jgi:prophage tail gpP-like protein
MTGYLTDKAGTCWRLPALLEWDVTHGLGEPSDCFGVRFLYSPGMADALHAACRFRAEHDGRTVFTGVVDEYGITADEAGMTAAVNGRGLAALLMDNEAEAAEYFGAGLDFIIGRHVAPFGITDIRKKPMSTAAVFRVTSGESNWKALREFCRFCGGILPRFTRDGILLLDGSAGDSYVIGPQTALTGQTFRETRFGVVSEVLVKSGTASVTVENTAFKAAGGSARRVVNVPRHTGYDAMRYTGAWQIEQSEQESAVCGVTLAEPFAAFAGDIVTLRAGRLGITGEFQVAESRTKADGGGARTTLKLIRR